MKRTLLHILCIFTLGLALLAGCNKAAAPAAETHSTTGVVVEVRPNVLVIQHQDFPGFMKGMTMPFELADPDLAKGIKPGDKVSFTLTKTEQGYPLTAIQKIP
jgi:Cu(I)/Ag(I) efflux system membrane fusion protein